jgi:hypothetical protein
MREVMLSTEDNPYDPFTQFVDWYRFDVDNGYDSCGLLSRVCATSSDLSEVENKIAIETAIDEIIKYNLSGKHIKLVREI